MRDRFPLEPVTVVVHRDRGVDEVWIGEYARWEAEDDPAVVLTIGGMGEERYFGLAEIHEVAHGLRAGTIAGSSQTVEVRQSYEADAITSITMGGMPRVPMPLDVIGYIHASNGEFLMPSLHAMAEDDGFVVTMLLNADAGLYVRYASAWHRLVNPDAIDGLSVHDVNDAALDMFDQFDRAGQLVHASSMSPSP